MHTGSIFFFFSNFLKAHFLFLTLLRFSVRFSFFPSPFSPFFKGRFDKIVICINSYTYVYFICMLYLRLHVEYATNYWCQICRTYMCRCAATSTDILFVHPNVIITSPLSASSFTYCDWTLLLTYSNDLNLLQISHMKVTTYQTPKMSA